LVKLLLTESESLVGGRSGWSSYGSAERDVVAEREVCGKAAEGVVLVKGMFDGRRERAEAVEGGGL
jgi:hypothetical protein